MNNIFEQPRQYWIEREARNIVKAEKQSTPAIETIKRIYAQNEKFILGELAKIYKHGLKSEDLTELELAQNFKDFTRRAKEAGFYDALPDAYKFRADRLTALNREIWLNTKQTGLEEYIATSQAYGRVIAETWKNAGQNIRAGQGFQQIPYETLERLMTMRPQGEDFAHAIWRNTDRLADRTTEALASGIQLGKSRNTIAREISELTGETIYNATRIVQTETNYYYNQTALEHYKALGIERYRFIAVLDRKTSATCHAHEGQTYKIEEAQVGENFPPLHPNCRSGTIAVFENEDPYTLNERMARYDFNSEPYVYDGRHPATFAGANTETSPNATINLRGIDPEAQKIIKQTVAELFAEFPQVARTLSEISTVNKQDAKRNYNHREGLPAFHAVRTDIIQNAREIIDDPSHLQIRATWQNEIKINLSFFKKNAIEETKKAMKRGDYGMTDPSLKGAITHEFGHAIHHFLSLKKQGFTNTQIDRMARMFNTGDSRTQYFVARKNSPALKLAEKHTKIALENHGIQEDTKLQNRTLAKFEKTTADISPYATHNDSEAFAELFAYSHRHPNEPMSKFFTDQLHKELNK